jgi:hypothetical protein
MGRLIVFARIYAAVIGFSFLFGQLFFGTFSILGSVIGLTAMTGAAISSPKAAQGVRYFAAVVCVAAMTGVALHVAEYYLGSPIQGDQYPWEVTAPFVVALALLVGSNIVMPSPVPEPTSRQ